MGSTQEPAFKSNLANYSMSQIVTPVRRTNSHGVQADDTRICVVMVGLPARGKSYIAQKCKSFALLVERH
jgi:6-phosphofructo-2-kinase/fructose-2,6-biphosphatase 2